MRRWIWTTLFGLMCTTAVTAAPTQPTNRTASAAVPVLRVMHPASATSGLASKGANSGSRIHVELDFRALQSLRDGYGGRIAFSRPQGEDLVLSLRSFALLAPDAVVTATGSSGSTPIPIDLKFYRGEVEGSPGSEVVLAVGPGRVLGSVRGPDFDLVIGPEPGSAAHYIADATQEVTKERPFTCATDELRSDVPHSATIDQAPDTLPLTESTRLVCRVAVDSDNEFYVEMGSNLTAATDYLLTSMAMISSTYERDVEVQLSVTYLNVWTTTDPYTSTNVFGLLPQFQSYWNANRTSVVRDVALLAADGLSGFGPAGLSYLDGLLSLSSAYAVDYFAGTSALTLSTVHGDAWTLGHELGHLFGSNHTHSCYWQAHGFVPVGTLLDSCAASSSSPSGGDYDPDRGPSCFLPTTFPIPPDKGTIMSVCHSSS